MGRSTLKQALWQRFGGRYTTGGIDFELLGVGMLIANDIIPFDRHHSFFTNQRTKTRRIEGRWHYPTGFIEASRFPFPKRIEEYRRILNELSVSGNATAERRSRSEYACYARLELPCNVRGYMVIKRRHPFSEAERLHFGLVAMLVQGAHSRPEIRDLVQRLHLNFLDGRTHLHTLKPRNIFQNYLSKALAVCHPEFSRPRALLPPKPPKIVVRTTAKMLTVSKTALRIAACQSTRPSEWTARDKATKYVLSQNDSIAARVYETLRPFWTNSYGAERNCKRIFDDSLCHLSVPIVAGKLSCLGVLSVETTAPEAYDEYTLAAFTLLGAHAAWALEHSVHREDAKRETQEFRVVTSTIQQLHHTKSVQEVLNVLKQCLQKLHFRRGLFCSVDHERQKVIGLDSWGDSHMANVCKWTRRDFKRDAVDCQIQAVVKCCEILIRNPVTDPMTNRDAYETGHLKPFGIFPIFDNHGQPIFTVHVEREDGEPIGPHVRI